MRAYVRKMFLFFFFGKLWGVCPECLARVQLPSLHYSIEYIIGKWGMCVCCGICLIYHQIVCPVFSVAWCLRYAMEESPRCKNTDLKTNAVIYFRCHFFSSCDEQWLQWAVLKPPVCEVCCFISSTGFVVVTTMRRENTVDVLHL